MTALIYIVEDDEGIREVYEGAFEGLYDVRSFETAKDFFAAFEARKPDLVLLDIMLPDQDGYTILSRIRAVDEKLPVIIVSAKTDEISFVKGLNRGADDYMAKPFSILELIARVKTNLRRASLYVTSASGFRIDRNVYKAYYGEQELGLTLKEFKLLALLIDRSGVTVEREELFHSVWNQTFLGESRTLDMHVASLREKLARAGAPDPIRTVRGVGYRFEPV